MGYTKGAKNMKMPSLFPIFGCVSANCMLLKLYSEQFYDAMSYFAVLLPLMIYLIIMLFGNLLKFIKMMHIEESEDESAILTVKQRKILTKVMRNLLGYFGLYFLSQQLDKFIRT